MCIAIPYRITEVNENGRACIEIGARKQEIDLTLVPDVAVGDYVLVYMGLATAKIEEKEALEIIRLFQEIVETETVHDRSPV